MPSQMTQGRRQSHRQSETQKQILHKIPDGNQEDQWNASCAGGYLWKATPKKLLTCEEIQKREARITELDGNELVLLHQVTLKQNQHGNQGQTANLDPIPGQKALSPVIPVLPTSTRKKRPTYLGYYTV